jgi:hypothetical protein
MASIMKKPSGRWQARVSMKGKAFSVGTFATKKEAEEAAAKFEAEVKPQLILDDPKEILKKELLTWQKRLENYHGSDRILIQCHMDRIEQSIQMYDKMKEEKDREAISKLPSFDIN